MGNIVLREYAYFDREKVEDFLSTIDDGLIRESTQIERQQDKKIKGEIGFRPLGMLGAEKGYGESELQILKTSTNASLFQRLYDCLNEQNMINNIDSIDQKLWNQIKVGDMLEINAKIEFSALDDIIDKINKLAIFMEAINPNEIDKKTKEALTGFQMLGQQSSNEGFNVKITPINNSRFKFVAILPKENVRVAKNQLTGNYNVICRVQKILGKNEKFELFKLLPGQKMNREVLRDFLKHFKDMPSILGSPPKMEDLQISYPAMLITPIVIYR